MILLTGGLALWWGAHLFKRIAPVSRARLGDAGKGLVAVLLVAGVVAMVVGYRSAATWAVWSPPAFLTHVNNLLVLVAFYLFGVGAAKGTAAGRLRHPQLTGVMVWAVAHLLVNGDAASIVLFGGLLAWAVVEVVVLDRSQPWVRPEAVSVRGDVKALGIGAVLYAVAAAVHVWLGVTPFG